LSFLHIVSLLLSIFSIPLTIISILPELQENPQEQDSIDDINLVGKRPPSNKFALGVPEDLLPRLRKLVDDPSAWWTGQFQKYYRKFLPPVKGLEILGSVKPLVGIYNRQEISNFPLEFYMEFVKEYYDVLEMKDGNVKRNVLLLSDAKDVLGEARKKYSGYVFYSREDFNITDSGLLVDLDLLSKCDQIIISDTTNFPRLVYEMMNIQYWDAYDRVISVSEVYHRGSHEMHFRHNSKSLNLNFNESIIISNSSQVIRTGLIEVTAKDTTIWIPEFKVKPVFDVIKV
jgi:hypothetical protein